MMRIPKNEPIHPENLWNKLKRQFAALSDEQKYADASPASLGDWIYRLAIVIGILAALQTLVWCLLERIAKN